MIEYYKNLFAEGFFSLYNRNIMKSFEEIFPLIVAVLVAIVLFLGIITSIKKSLRAPAPKDTIDSSLQLKEQQRRMDDVQRRQKELMRDQKQRIRDLQRQ